MCEHESGLVLPRYPPDDLARNHRLTRAGRRYEHNALVARRDAALGILNDVGLIRPQDCAHATSACIGRKSLSAKASARIAWIRSSPSALISAWAVAMV